MINNKCVKKQFTDNIKFNKGKKVKCEYHTFAIYRYDDRLIWTIQELCEDMKITVKDDTGLDRNISCWINHPNGETIIAGKRNIEDNIIEFSFGNTILPYQGIELSWSFNKRQT
jgi:hypothetical protein